MKVIEKREYSFDNEDLKLLKETLPDNPCEKCSPSERMVCCGCPDRREYDKVIEVYKDHNIYEIACAIHKVDALVDEETKLKTQIQAVKRDIAEATYRQFLMRFVQVLITKLLATGIYMLLLIMM